MHCDDLSQCDFLRSQLTHELSTFCALTGLSGIHDLLSELNETDPRAFDLLVRGLFETGFVPVK